MMDTQDLPAHFRSAKALLMHARAQRVAAIEARYSPGRVGLRDRWAWLLSLAVIPGWRLFLVCVSYALLRAPGLRPFPSAFVLAMSEAMNPRLVRIDALACLRAFLEDRRAALIPDGSLGFRDPALPTQIRVARLGEAVEVVRGLERSPDPVLKNKMSHLRIALVYFEIVPAPPGPNERDRMRHFMATFDQDIAPRLRAAFIR